MEIVEAHGDSIISDFGIILNSQGNYEFNQSSDTQKLRLLQIFTAARRLMSLPKSRKMQQPTISSNICVPIKLLRIWTESEKT